MAVENMDVDSEMDLLERVFLRFGSADSDEQLEAVLGKFLVPVLGKLASNITRKKVMELLVHVNKRVKSRPKVQLPMNDLVLQYQDQSTPAFVSNFTIIYVKIGYPRLEIKKKVELVPLILHSLEERPSGHQDSLLQLIVPVLGSIDMPSSMTEQKEKYGLVNKPVCLELLLNHCQNYLLLPYCILPPPLKNAPPSLDTPVPTAPAGLSFASYRKLFSETLPIAEEVEESKVAILKFLATQGLFDEQKVGIHFIIALSDSRHRVATAADKEIKRILGSVDLNDARFVEKLYSLYQGSTASKQQSLETVRTPGNTRMRLKIFPYFLRSQATTNHFPGCLQIIFDSLFGQNTNHKLKTMTVQFVHHVCLYAEDDKFLPIAAVLLSAMTKFLAETLTDLKLRGLIYLAIGKIARRTPTLIATDMTLLTNLFEAVGQEETETRLAVQETLSMLSGVVSKHISPSNLPLLEALVMQNIEKEDAQSRLMAVHYARSVFPPDHVPSRYVLLLAAGDTKDDIRAQAVKSLIYTPSSEKQLLEVRMDVDAGERMMPNFGEMIKYVLDKADLRMKSNNKYVLGNHAVAFNPGTFTQLLTYLRQCLAYDAGVELDSDGQHEHGTVLGEYVRQLFSRGDSSVQSYVEFLVQHISIFGGQQAMFFLLEIVAVSREILSMLFVERLDWIRSLMFSMQELIRERAAELFAIVLVTGTRPETMVQRLEALAKNFDHKSEETVSGALLGVAFTIGRVFLFDKADTMDEALKSRLDALATKAVLKMDINTSNISQVLSLSAFVSLGELSRCTRLPLSNESTDDKDVTKLTVVRKLIGVVHRTKETSKVREKAATTLGLMCLGEPEFAHRRVLMDGLIDCAGPHQLELHFTVGEALVNAALANAASLSRDSWTVSLKQFDSVLLNRTKHLELSYLITTLLEKANAEENPHKKQALCIWLLSIVKQCGAYQDVQNNLKRIQVAFMHLLIENNEVTQDIASKGLGTVYEVCGEGLKDELVQLLVRTLTTGQTENQNLSTYKELCAIASDLNQPDLVYKFMHLANNQGVWKQKGAHLGFGTVSQQAAQQLAPQLHKIVPKLYRYQYDPNSKIQGAMTSIWSAVVPDTKGTVDKYIRDILNDLLKNLTSGQWRVRESSCLALADLLRGRNLEDDLERLPDLWDTCFKVRDDMKESVRNAAETALRSLNRLTVKLCDVNNGKLGERAVSLVFPPLLKNGLLSSCKEVRAIGLDTILKVSKNAGALLKPHIPLLVGALLESLSGLEPQVNDYISLHVGNDESTREKLDMARIGLSRGSAMMETVNLCTQYVDESVIGELVPRLIELLRSGIGVGTKAGVAAYVVSLIQNDASMMAPYAGKLMSALLSGLNDKSLAVKKCYATALGHVVRIAKPSSTERLMARLQNWYFEKEDETFRIACGVIIYEICKSSPDVLEQNAQVALPLAFLAMHDEKKNTIWADIWNDATAGTESGIKLYLPQILAVSQTALTSQSWPMKAQAARAIKTIVDKSKTGLEQPHAGELIRLLMEGLSGRIWEGKETLLQAFCSVCISCKPVILNDLSLDMVLEPMYKECKKEKLAYKIEALQCYANVAEAFEADKFTQVYTIIQPIIDKRIDEDENEDETEVEEAEERNSEAFLKFEDGSLKILGQLWPASAREQSNYVLDFSALLTENLKLSTWRLQIQTMKTLLTFWERLVIAEVRYEDVLNAVNCLVGPLCKCLVDLKYAAVRTVALELTSKVLARLKENSLDSKLSENVVVEIYDSLDGMITENQPVLVEKLEKVRKTLRILLGAFDSPQQDAMEVVEKEDSI